MTWRTPDTFHAGYEPPALVLQFRATLGRSDPMATVHIVARPTMMAAEKAAASIRSGH